MYYTVIKDDSIWEHKGNVENTSRRRLFSTFLNCSWVFLRGGGKKKKHTFSLFYTLIKHGLLTNQSVCRVPPPLLCTTFVICCHFLRCLYQLKKNTITPPINNMGITLWVYIPGPALPVHHKERKVALKQGNSAGANTTVDCRSWPKNDSCVVCCEHNLQWKDWGGEPPSRK